MTHEEVERTPAQKKRHEKLTAIGDLWEREIKPDLLLLAVGLVLALAIVVAIVGFSTIGGVR